MCYILVGDLFQGDNVCFNQTARFVLKMMTKVRTEMIYQFQKYFKCFFPCGFHL